VLCEHLEESVGFRTNTSEGFDRESGEILALQDALKVVGGVLGGLPSPHSRALTLAGTSLDGRDARGVRAREVDIKHVTCAENHFTIRDLAALKGAALVEVQATEHAAKPVEEANAKLMTGVGHSLAGAAAREGMVDSFGRPKRNASRAHTDLGEHVELEKPKGESKDPLNFICGHAHEFVIGESMLPGTSSGGTSAQDTGLGGI
jgi:hypothetical protein